MITVRPETGGDAATIAGLYASAFGPGQYARAASLLREGNAPLEAACMVAEDDGMLIGACRIWPLQTDAGSCVLLGPIAVETSRRKDGIGAMLTQTCLAACDNLGVGCVVLVGDIPYFGQFGFEPVPDGQLVLPVPADPRRLLWRLRSSAQPPKGRLRA